ncbi:MAG: SurA N-terminal domain-containing protein [Deltaproteobacteria bacterium]|nr:MAG: SurA N-terminal domain-containing protein [Deltaproteobacteria bacterium]
MRKHANSWLVKTVLGLIILTFILFFGYSRLANRYQDSHQFIAKVGDSHITRKKYEINLEATMNRFRENMKEGGFPEGLRGFVEQNVIQQLIQRELMSQYALTLPLDVSDEELANAIRDDKNIFPDGKFDLINYREKFLPFYRANYGENFEDVIRRQILIEKMGVVVEELYNPWHDELEKSLSTINSQKKQIQEQSQKAENKKVKKAPETEKETFTNTASIDSNQLFTLWLNQYREKLKVENYLKP